MESMCIIFSLMMHLSLQGLMCFTAHLCQSLKADMFVSILFRHFFIYAMHYFFLHMSEKSQAQTKVLCSWSHSVLKISLRSHRTALLPGVFP